MNMIDKEALDHAKWLSDYCRKHSGLVCMGCIFFRPDQEEMECFDNNTCMLKRADADQWFGPKK